MQPYRGGGAVKQIIALILLVSGCYGSLEQTVPFRLEKGYLIVAKCSIGGLQDLTAIVDTGVTETVIDSTIVQRLHLVAKSDTAVFVAKEAPVQSLMLPSVSFGPIRVASLEAITTDLSSLTRQFGFRPDVLIGMDILHRSSLIIDYKAHVLRFELDTSFSHAASLIDGGRFAMVEAVVSGQAMRLQLDTGLSGLMVYQDRLRGQLSVPSQAIRATLAGVAASFETNTISDQQLRVGNWTGYQLPVTVIDRHSQFVEFDGLLGARTLTSHRLCLDFSHMMMYWD
jgi:predicted aspartyl protease